MPACPSTVDDRVAPFVGCAVFLVVAGLSVAMAAPAAHWLDSAEFAAASWELGNAHPPGHPLAILLGKAATMLPLGGIAFRVNCASAIALGVAAVLLTFMIHRVARTAWERLGPELDPLPPAIGWPVAALGALGLSLGHAALYQGVRAEVYGLNLAINLGVLHLALRYLIQERPRDLYAAGLLVGLGLGNHHLLTLALGPALIACVALARFAPWRRRLHHVGIAAAAGLLGLTVLLQLPVRSTRAPMINWGAPHRVERFGWTVSARLFARTARKSIGAKPSNRAAHLARAVNQELGPGILLAALGGLVLLGLRRRLAALLAVLGLAAAANGAAAVIAGFEATNPDSLGYVLLLLALLTLAAAAAIAIGLARLRLTPRWRVPAVILAAALGIWPAFNLATAAGRVDLRQAYGAEVASELLLDTAPPRALLLTSYYQTGFGVWAARLLAGARPDVDHVHRSYLGQPGYVDNLLGRRPALEPLLARARRPGALDYRRLVPEARKRAVLFEFDDDTFDRAMIEGSAPEGPIYRLLLPGARPTARDPARLRRSRARWQHLEQRLQTTGADKLTRMYLLWVSYLNARYHLRRGDCAAARPGWERARKLGRADDPALLRIKRRCRF